MGAIHKTNAGSEHQPYHVDVITAIYIVQPYDRTQVLAMLGAIFQL